MAASSITENRKTFRYRFLEAFIGLFSLAFLLLLVILAFTQQAVFAVFIIIYSFLMVLKTSLHGIYTIYTYKNLIRWENLDWLNVNKVLTENFAKGKELLLQIQKKHENTLDWSHQLQQQIETYEQIKDTKYANFNGVTHFPLFSIYNESPEVLSRSLESIYKSGYPLDKLLVFISQEGRMGEDFNAKIRSEIAKLPWVKVNNNSEKDLEIVYNSNHDELDYKNASQAKIKIAKEKLNIFFTQHPDGLVGEIKGKASNEDWGGRQVSLFVKATGLDPDLVLVTSLDADSSVGPNFFQMLSYKFALTPNRHQAGFQPLPVYTNNFFQAHIFPRLVAVNTTIWYMILTSLPEELGFFANYAVPLKVLRKIDFWNREVIAEDSLLFAKCLVTFNGNFKVVPFYGTFEGDAVDGEDIYEAFINQFKQLQRWAWGGIEGFPYKVNKFFFEPGGRLIDLRVRIRHTALEFLNHFFWSTSPLVFSLFVFLPVFFGSAEFLESTVNLNFFQFTQYFSWMSFIFLGIASFITFRYIAARALKMHNAKWYQWVFLAIQWIISPFMFVLWGPPALDVQIRGILGKYLGYWVTPKK